jgi:hypothetical protein
MQNRNNACQRQAVTDNLSNVYITKLWPIGFRGFRHDRVLLSLKICDKSAIPQFSPIFVQHTNSYYSILRIITGAHPDALPFCHQSSVSTGSRRATAAQLSSFW